MIPARTRDHGGVVGIEAWAGDGDARLPAEPLSREIAQRFTTRHPTPQHGGLVSGEIDRALELRDEHLEHRVLKAARDMRPVALDVVRGAHGVEDGGLEAGKRELESLGNHRPRECKAGRIAIARDTLDLRAARISETAQGRDLE